MARSEVGGRQRMDDDVSSTVLCLLLRSAKHGQLHREASRFYLDGWGGCPVIFIALFFETVM